MFVSSLSEVDLILSQVNILLSKVNEKLDQCPVETRRGIVPRVYHIVSELEWTMSLSKGGSECGDDKEVNCTYSGALSPPPSSSSSDTESLTWDSFEENFYKIYYDENDADDEDEEIIERKYDNDDHGPIKISTSSHNELPKDEENIPDSEVEQDEDVTDEDDCAKFVKDMSEKINLLASDGKYKIVRPIKYTIDFTRVNKFFMRNIPDPKSFPIQGCSQDPAFYDRHGARRDRDGFYIDRFSPNHYKDYPPPHGRLFGYETDIGIVPVPEEAVNGYVWKNNDWILHAVVDDGTGTPSRGSWSPQWKRRGG